MPYHPDKQQQPGTELQHNSHPQLQQQGNFVQQQQWNQQHQAQWNNWGASSNLTQMKMSDPYQRTCDYVQQCQTWNGTA